MDSVHYKDTVAPRALTSDEAMELRKLLKATLLIDNANQRISMTTREQDEEDVIVLIDYTMHMVEDGRNVGHMSEELVLLGLPIFGASMVDDFEECLSTFLNELLPTTSQRTSEDYNKNIAAKIRGEEEKGDIRTSEDAPPVPPQFVRNSSEDYNKKIAAKEGNHKQMASDYMKTSEEEKVEIRTSLDVPPMPPQFMRNSDDYNKVAAKKAEKKEVGRVETRSTVDGPSLPPQFVRNSGEVNQKIAAKENKRGERGELSADDPSPMPFHYSEDDDGEGKAVASKMKSALRSNTTSPASASNSGHPSAGSQATSPSTSAPPPPSNASSPERPQNVSRVRTHPVTQSESLSAQQLQPTVPASQSWEADSTAALAHGERERELERKSTDDGPQFYAVEATLVRSTIDSASEQHQSLQPSGPIYDAVIMTEESSPPRMKRRIWVISIGFILVIGAMAVAMALLLKPKDPDDGPPPVKKAVPPSNPSSSHSPQAALSVIPVGNILRDIIVELPEGCSCNATGVISDNGNVAVVGSGPNGGVYFFPVESDDYTKMSSGFFSDQSMNSIAMSDEGDIVVAVDTLNEAVLVYEKGELHEDWYLRSQLSFPSDLVGIEGIFGGAIAVKSNWIVVGGAPGANSVYMFRRRRNIWSEFQKLAPRDDLHSFGVSLSLECNTLVVGDDTFRDDSGAVFIYDLDPILNLWALSRDEPLMDGDCMFGFGASLAIAPKQNGLFIGCTSDQDEHKAVYYYTRTDARGQYEFAQKIALSEQDPVGGFGESIAVHGDVMGIGASNVTSGRVYMFTFAEGIWYKALTVDGPTESEFFGSKVDMSGNQLLVSSKHDVHLYKLDLASSGPTQSMVPSSSKSPSHLPTSSLAPSQLFMAVSLVYSVDTDDNPSSVSIGHDTAVIASGDSGAQMYSYNSTEDTWVEDESLNEYIGEYIDHIILSGDFLVAKSPVGNYLYMLEMESDGSWVYTQDTVLNCIFGHHIGFDGSTLVVDEPGQKKLKLYQRRNDDTWLEGSLTMEKKSEISSIFVNGNFFVVGHEESNQRFGAISIFSKVLNEDGSLIWRAMSNDLSRDKCNQFFGSSLALVPETNGLLVGCDNGRSDGIVFYYTLDPLTNNYELRQTLTSFNEGGSVSFAHQIAVDGRIMVITDPGVKAEDGASSGMAFVYALMDGFWLEAATISAPESSFGFGAKLDLHGTNIVITTESSVRYYKMESSIWTSSPTMSPTSSSSPTETIPSQLPSTSLSPTETCFSLEVDIFTDQYPDEISWNITRSSEVIYETGLLSHVAKSSEYRHILCLPEGEYLFGIYDSANDGICCGYSIGNYSLTIDEEVIVQGGEYARNETTSFRLPHDVAFVFTNTTTRAPTPAFSAYPTRWQDTPFPTPAR